MTGLAMDLPTGTRRFVYDAGGRVMGEYGASAVDVKAEFIWLSPKVGVAGTFGGDDGLGGYMPLAVATPDNGGTVQLNWVYGGHLGVALLTTDASGNPATTPGDYLAPGFPGQSRVLADLYYNRYRDYDPSTGRYIQADPIGLAGGSNPFGYALANPVGQVDPDGLNPAVLFRGAVAAGELGGGGLIWWCRINIAACMRTVGPPAIRIAKTCAQITQMVWGGSNVSKQQAADRKRYHSICDQPPPPGLTEEALLRWKLSKAQMCLKARQEFTDKWYGGKFDPGHQAQMDQLRREIFRLQKLLGL